MGINLKHRLIILIALLFFFFSLVYQHFAGQQNILSLIKQGEPDTAKFESLGGEYPSYKLWDGKGNFLGYAAIAGSSGYGGKLTVLNVVEETGQIKSVSILENHETPTYLKKVLNSGILGKIAKQNVQDSLAGVDAVSGATITSEAIITAVQKGSAQIGNRELGMKILYRQKVVFTWKDLAAIGLLVIAILGAAFNVRKFRPWLLALSSLFIGFLCNYSLTFGSFVGLLSGNLPVFTERPVWHLMVPGILLITLVWGKNFYCSWLCPFGAVQEGIYHSLNLFQFSPSPAIKSKVARLRWPLLWLAAITALIFNNGQIAGYEPFPVFFNASGNTAQWLITIIVVFMSIAQIRYWCNSFCPVGAILNFLARLKRNLKRSRRASEESEPSATCSQCANRDCAEKLERLSKQDKVFAGVAVVVNLLILMALLQNILFTLQN